MNLVIDGRPLDEPQPGGVTRFVYGLTQTLSKEALRQGHHVTVWTNRWKKVRPEHIIPLEPGVTFKQTRFPNRPLNLACTLQLVGIDRLFPNTDHLFITNLDFTGKLTTPYSLFVHDIAFLVEPRWFSRKSRLWHGFMRAKALIEDASLLFTSCEFNKQELIRVLHIPKERITVVPPGIEGLAQPTSNTRPLATPYVFALGANDPRKNAAFLYTVMRELPQLTLVVTSRTIKVPVQEKNILHIPYPSTEELARWMKYAVAFLYPSWYEGFGIPLHEAASLGTPCISSRFSCLPETAPPGTILLSPVKPHLWREAISEQEKRPTPPAFHPQTWDEAAKIIVSKLI